MTTPAPSKPSTATSGIIRPGTTRVASIGALPGVLLGLRVPLEPLLDAVGLPRSVFDDRDGLIELQSASQLLNLAAHTARCPHLGLLCGKVFRPETIGIVGLLAQNAKDVASALRGIALNLHLNGHAFVATLNVGGGLAEFSLRMAADLPGETSIATDVGMAGACAILRSLCGPTWQPSEVTLIHAPLGGRKPYDSYYRVAVQFGADRNAILFPAAWLGRPVHGATLARRLELERELAVATGKNKLSTTLATRRILMACISRGVFSVDDVVQAAGLHRRTLNRRLALEGTSVFALMKDVRYQIARDLLANSALSVTEIAATLAYADIGAFTRAFRQWAGKNPSDWRREHQ